MVLILAIKTWQTWSHYSTRTFGTFLFYFSATSCWTEILWFWVTIMKADFKMLLESLQSLETYFLILKFTTTQLKTKLKNTWLRLTTNNCSKPTSKPFGVDWTKNKETTLPLLPTTDDCLNVVIDKKILNYLFLRNYKNNI